MAGERKQRREQRRARDETVSSWWCAWEVLLSVGISSWRCFCRSSFWTCSVLRLRRRGCRRCCCLRRRGRLRRRDRLRLRLRRRRRRRRRATPRLHHAFHQKSQAQSHLPSVSSIRRHAHQQRLVRFLLVWQVTEALVSCAPRPRNGSAASQRCPARLLALPPCHPPNSHTHAFTPPSTA